MICPTCEGTGSTPKMFICPICDGNLYVWIPMPVVPARRRPIKVIIESPETETTP